MNYPKIPQFLLMLIPVFLLGCSYTPEEQLLSETLHIEENRDYIIITPNREWFSMTGLLFYPGAFVDPHAYIETLSRFAVSGRMHQIVIAKMPLNLAILGSQKGKWLYDQFPYIKRWVVSGHSLGGVAASALVHNYPDFFFGLALFASYPQAKHDLSDWSQTVLSIRGEHDLIVPEEEIVQAAEYLPFAIKIDDLDKMPTDQGAKTIYYTIPGGNHAYFGKYGEQSGDGTATITRSEQVVKFVKMLQKWFDSYGWDD